MWFKETVSHKKKLLSSLLKAPIEQLARQCVQHWEQPDRLIKTLQASLCKLPHCQLLYAVAPDGLQLSANITRGGIDNTWRGQDLSARPFLQGILPFRGMVLSAAYLSQRSMQPCITALQAVRQDERLLGFVAADFHLKDLPNMSGTPLQRMQQFHQEADQLRHRQQPSQRHSAVDQNIDYLIYVLSTLMQEHGIFHCRLHFASACACLWSMDRPMDDALHSVDELLDPALFQRYPKRSYDSHTRLELDRIPLVFTQLKALRQTDDRVYLRSGSVNIINGRIGLSFSSDGSHYMSSDEFLNHDLNYWLDLDDQPEELATPATPN
ncbi:MAG: hypothetical protein P8Z75_00880 [Gammaproteobacteria bacterium]